MRRRSSASCAIAGARYKGGMIARIGDTVRFVAFGMSGWPYSASVMAEGTVVRVGERSVVVDTRPTGGDFLKGATVSIRLSVCAHRASLVSRAESQVVGS